MSDSDKNQNKAERGESPAERHLLRGIPYGDVEIRDITAATKGRLKLAIGNPAHESRETGHDFPDKLEEISENLKKVVVRRSLTMAEYVAVNSYLKKRLKIIFEAFQIFKSLSDEFVRENADRRILHPDKDRTLQQILDALRADDFSVKMKGENFFTWEKACSIFDVVIRSRRDQRN